jgi:hypothetical protein
MKPECERCFWPTSKASAAEAEVVQESSTSVQASSKSAAVRGGVGDGGGIIGIDGGAAGDVDIGGGSGAGVVQVGGGGGVDIGIGGGGAGVVGGGGGAGVVSGGGGAGVVGGGGGEEVRSDDMELENIVTTRPGKYRTIS